jgi:hypothetical protein
MLANPAVIFVPEDALHLPTPLGKTIVCLRHDLDCLPDRLNLLLNVELSLGLRSTIYFLTDGTAYEPLKFSDAFKTLQEKGFAFGLHTLAPAMPDTFKYFESECRLFSAVMGSFPRLYTIHGVIPHPENWEQKRLHFESLLADFRRENDISACSQFISNLHVVEDSRCGGIFGYLRDDFFLLPDIAPEKKIVLLTHPEHWTEHLLPNLDVVSYRSTWRDCLRQG